MDRSNGWDVKLDRSFFKVWDTYLALYCLLDLGVHSTDFSNLSSIAISKHALYN